MPKIFKVLLAVCGLMLASGYVIATVPADHVHDGSEQVDHSGGTDAYGCHTNRKTGVYHCH